MSEAIEKIQKCTILPQDPRSVYECMDRRTRILDSSISISFLVQIFKNKIHRETPKQNVSFFSHQEQTQKKKRGERSRDWKIGLREREKKT